MKIFLFLLVVVLYGWAYNQDDAIKHVSAKEFEELISQTKGILIDVRTEREHNNSHIANSVLMNFYSPDFRTNILKLPKDTTIFLYCYVGNRSSIAARFLIENGYKNVYNLRKGILEWHSLSLPIVSSSLAAVDAVDMMSENDFNSLISSQKLVFVDFYAPWCAPCKMMMPMIDSLKIEYKDKINIVKINSDASRPLVQKLSVRAIPYFAFYKNGNLVFTHNGIITREELVKVFNEHL